MKTVRYTSPSGASVGALVLAGLLLGLAACPPADARGRFGGGRSSGLTRTLSVPESHVPHASAGALPRAVDSHAYAAPATPSATFTAAREAAMSAAMLARRAEIAAANQRIRDAHLSPLAHRAAPRSVGDAPASAAAPAIADLPPAQAPAGALPAVRTMRPADPDFGKLTSHPVIAVACEIKPVMSDDDYRACGATPPSLPPLGQRN